MTHFVSLDFRSKFFVKKRFRQLFNMDGFLNFLGLYRSDVAKDSTCLFRALSEQLFGTQIYHEYLLEKCVEYIKRHKYIFKAHTEDLDQHLEDLKNQKIWAGPMEMHALSFKYRITFEIYVEIGQPPLQVTSDFADKVVVLAGFSGNRYDCVYSKSNLSISAVCQSAIYEILYKRVFCIQDVDFAVEKMLHDKSYSKQRKNQSKQSLDSSVDLGDSGILLDPGQDTKKSLEKGIPPFPYKVAKALDLHIYRNVEFDIWNEKKKETLRKEQFITPEVGPGVRCKVYLNNDPKESFIGHVQDVKEDLVTVYIEELCKRCSLKRDKIEVIPIPQYKALTWQGGKTYKVNNQWNSRIEHDKSKKKNFRYTTDLVSPGNHVDIDIVHEQKKSYVPFNSRYKNTPRTKQYNTTPGNYKRSNCYNNRYETPTHRAYTPCNDVAGTSPPVDDDSGIMISNSYQSAVTNEDSSLMSPIYQTASAEGETFYPRVGHYETPELNPEDLKYGFPAPHHSTPLQIPKVGYHPYQPADEISTLAMTPVTPNMAFLPTYYMYTDASHVPVGVNVMPYYGYDVNAGFSSLMINTPPLTGVTPPTWISSPLTPQYAVPPNSFVCSPPSMSDPSIAIGQVGSPATHWGTSPPQFNYIIPAQFPQGTYPPPKSE